MLDVRVLVFLYACFVSRSAAPVHPPVITDPVPQVSERVGMRRVEVVGTLRFVRKPAEPAWGIEASASWMVTADGKDYDLDLGAGRAELARALEGKPVRVIGRLEEREEYVGRVPRRPGEPVPQIARVIMHRVLHVDRLEARPGASVAVSADGKRLAVAGDDRTITVFDVATGKVTERWKSVRRRGPMAVTAAGTVLVAYAVQGSDGPAAARYNWCEVRVLDVGSGKERTVYRANTPASLPGIGANGEPRAFTADGRRLAVRSVDAGGTAAVVLVDVTG
jgi:hypothetical protein